MDYKNCIRCNKLFNYESGPILCRECNQIVFDKIKGYLEKNKLAPAKTISTDLKIPFNVVKAYLKDDRLMVVRGNDVKLCALCGDIISEGNYCEICLKNKKTVSAIASLQNIRDNLQHKKIEMHYLNNAGNKRKK